jgi:hypothetical protein
VTTDDPLADFARLQEALIGARARIQHLLGRGYPSAAAQQRFEPFFDEFARGFDQVNGGLRGISEYVHTVRGTDPPTDFDLDSRLG